MSEDRADDATADEDGGEGDGGDEKIIGPTETVGSGGFEQLQQSHGSLLVL